MKTNLNDLKNFLELVGIKGEEENKEILVETKNGMEILTINPTKTFSIYGKMKGDFKELTTLGIGNLRLLLTFLNNFNTKNIHISKNANKLNMISGDGKVEISYCLQNPETIKNIVEYDKIKTIYDNKNESFILAEEVIKEIIKLSKSIGSDKINLKWNKKGLNIYLENNENTILASFEGCSPKNEEEEVNLKISRLLVDILETITPNEGTIIYISLKNLSPIILEVVNENYDVIYLLAPFKK